MVSEQLGITVTEALIRLRAYAFAQDRTLTDIANDVVTGGFASIICPATRRTRDSGRAFGCCRDSHRVTQ